MLEALTGTGLAASAGLNAYIPLLLMGLLARFTDLIDLPQSSSWLTNGWTLLILAVLLVIEMVADKVPLVDHMNDVLQTVVRPTAGGLAFGAGSASQTVTVSDPGSFFGSHQWVPVAAGVLIALCVHGVKAASRPVVNATTAGFGAPVASTAEDIGAVLMSLLAIVLPVLVLVGLLLMVWGGVWGGAPATAAAAGTRATLGFRRPAAVWLTAVVPALAVPAFALTWWAACYLIGRDPGRRASWRAAAALVAYALGVAVWTVTPGSAPAQVLICVPALFWAGTAVALLPETLPERRQLDQGWLVLSVLFLVTVIALPTAGRLVALAPLIGGLVLLWRFRDQVRPQMLTAAMVVAAVLYGLALAALLLPAELGADGLLLAAIGLDLLMLGFLVAVGEAIDVGERLRPDLIRSVTGALVATVLAGGPAALTLLAAPGERWVAALQFVGVGVVMTLIGLGGPIRRGLDLIAFPGDERLRQDRLALLLLADALPRHRLRHRLISTAEDDFHRFTRQALDNFDDLGRLMRSPLTDLPAVDHRLTGLGIEQPLARAMELRSVLQESVDRLRPPGPFETTDDWRYYNALHFCSLLGLNPYERRSRTDGLDREARKALEWMRRYVPRRVLRRWQTEGAAMVATRLWDELVREDPRRSPQPRAEAAIPDTQHIMARKARK